VLISAVPFVVWGIDAGRGSQQTLNRLVGLDSSRGGLAMGTNKTPGAGAGGVGQRIEEAIELIEMELRHAIAYVNDAVIPQVRRESISAMRVAADTLRDLADRFEQRTNQATNQARNQPQDQPLDEPPDQTRGPLR